MKVKTVCLAAGSFTCFDWLTRNEISCGCPAIIPSRHQITKKDRELFLLRFGLLAPEL